MDIETVLWVSLMGVLIIAGVTHVINSFRAMRELNNHKDTMEKFNEFLREMQKNEFEIIKSKLNSICDSLEDIQINVMHNAEQSEQIYHVLDDQDERIPQPPRQKRKYTRRVKVLEHKEEPQ